MLVVLMITCLILVFWVAKLSSKVEEQQKINQYNFDVYQRQFKEIEQAFGSEKEQREHLLDRIHDLESDSRNKG